MNTTLAATCLVVAIAVSAAHADTVGDCNQTREAQLRLHACSEIISATGYGPTEKSIAYRNRGSARADAGAQQDALTDYDQAIRLRPDDAAAYAGRAPVRLVLRDLDGAVADYSEALRLAPGTASLHVGRGHAHFVRGDTTAAVADFTEAIKLAPNSASTYNHRGLAYRRSGDLAHALEDYSAAIAINPVYALAYNNRGYVYEAQGRTDEAIFDFKAALLLDPSLIGASDGLRRLGVAEGLLAESARRVQQGRVLVEKNCSRCHAVGVTGISPNGRAPEFRSLHARHPGLALREPLSRGIAAPHDEMPHFTLSEAEVGTIIAYINSLSAPRTRNPVVPISDATDNGDPRKGFAYAERFCSGCHNILRTEAASPDKQAPPFMKVANTPGMSVTALTVWSRTSHPTMPNLVIEPADMDNLMAYILSLRNR
jgi:tetratricopeptide (TPR) repeat protein